MGDIVAETKDMLMDAAEIGIRKKGYNAVSFRELADDLGIKSASVHYYFRKKEDLGLALVIRYKYRFFEALNGQAEGAKGPADKVAAFCKTYRDALISSEAICLGGMLGAETCSLPDKLAKEVSEFFEANIRWLEAELPSEWSVKKRRARAGQIVATLQGAMMLATNLKDTDLFDRTAENLLIDIALE